MNTKPTTGTMTRREAAISYRTSSNFKPGDFVLSDINKKWLQEKNINKTINDFKALVRATKPYRTCTSGNLFIATHNTNVWNLSQFKGGKII